MGRTNGCRPKRRSNLAMSGDMVGATAGMSGGGEGWKLGMAHGLALRALRVSPMSNGCGRGEAIDTAASSRWRC
jgi:hypothetical protein